VSRSTTPPRYRVKLRQLGEANLVVGFADTTLVVRALMAVYRSPLLRQRERGQLVVIDQDDEAIVERRDVP
jgi:hypothetical protein